MPIDYSRYPPNWKSEIVPRILERAGDCCEKCGIKNRSAAVSIPLKIYDTPRYKIKRFWLTNESDINRMQLYAYPNMSEVKTVKVVLTIAHLDHDEENHDVKDDRLMAMCQICHSNYDAAEKYRRACNKK